MLFERLTRALKDVVDRRKVFRRLHEFKVGAEKLLVKLLRNSSPEETDPADAFGLKAFRKPCKERNHRHLKFLLKFRKEGFRSDVRNDDGFAAGFLKFRSREESRNLAVAQSDSRRRRLKRHFLCRFDDLDFHIEVGTRGNKPGLDLQPRERINSARDANFFESHVVSPQQTTFGLKRASISL